MNEMLDLSLYFIKSLIELIPTNQPLMFVFGLTMFIMILNILNNLLTIKK